MEGLEPLCLCEGYATGASIYEATSYPVAVAFNTGNLLPVAQSLRARFPDSRLVLCADDDAATDGNPGLTKAKEAARAVGGLLAVPDFGEIGIRRGPTSTTWLCTGAWKADRRAIASAKAPARAMVETAIAGPRGGAI